MYFSVLTLGCKVNAYESEAIKEDLQKLGYQATSNYQISDLIIVNTCAVTTAAEAKSLKLIRRIQRENPKALLVVCGCGVQSNVEAYQNLGIHLLLGNNGKVKIKDLVPTLTPTKRIVLPIQSHRNLKFEPLMVTTWDDRTRAFLKVQDGCNNFCTYCLIPFLRGNERSKPFKTCIKEAQALVAHGHQEIVLTGINLGTYQDSGHDLTDLIKTLSQIQSLVYIRISSIEVNKINSKLKHELKQNPKICNQLHIPLQSGSDYILKQMKRPYNRALYQETIEEIRKERPDIAITTDVIVGFPGETEEHFQATYDFCQQMNFAKIHVFPYSKRPLTAAAQSLNLVSDVLKKTRTTRLLQLAATLEAKFYQRYLNCKVIVLVEQVKFNFSLGHTSNYLKVKINRKLTRGKLVTVKIKSYQNGFLIAL